MQRDVARSQALTLREWADVWERESRVGGALGFAEVAFRLRNAATQIERVASGDHQTVEPSQDLTVTPDTTEFRDG